MKKLIINGQRFLDEDGREILLHGINFVCKENEHGYIWPNAAELFHKFAGMGFNLIRFGIFWNAAEPAPGVYDDAYIQEVRKTLKTAEAEGLYVLLDMHQDLFSCLYGDGAPAWATLTDGKPHPEGMTMWYDAYLQSEAILAAADHFWQNDPAEDGVGLVDHYVATWKHIAQALKDCGSIIGAEPMNEPFMGSLARNSFGMAAYQVQQQYPEFDLMKQQGITPESQGMFTQIVGESFVKFDRDVLMPFYAKINEALRTVWDVPITTGGNIYCSSMFPTGLERVTTADGKPAPQIYDVHAYDAVTDTGSLDGYNHPLMIMQLEMKRASQQRLNIPVILGEWGAFPSLPFTGVLLNQMNAEIEKYLWSTAYWQYLPGFEKDDNFSALVRGYPMKTEGRLESYRWDPEKLQLQVCFTGSAVTCFVPGKVKEVAGSEPWRMDRETEKGCVVTVRFPENEKHLVNIQA